MGYIFEGSFTEEETGAGRYLSEGGLNYFFSEARKKFYCTASVDQINIGKKLGSNCGVIAEQAVEKSLENYEKC